MSSLKQIKATPWKLLLQMPLPFRLTIKVPGGNMVWTTESEVDRPSEACAIFQRGEWGRVCAAVELGDMFAGDFPRVHKSRKKGKQVTSQEALGRKAGDLAARIYLQGAPGLMRLGKILRHIGGELIKAELVKESEETNGRKQAGLHGEDGNKGRGILQGGGGLEGPEPGELRPGAGLPEGLDTAQGG